MTPPCRRRRSLWSRPDGTSSVEPSFDIPSGEQLVPYSAQNNLITTGCVLLPSDIGAFGDMGDVVEAVRAFLRRYVDLSPQFEEIAAYYVLLTWVYDAFTDLPYLRLQGTWGTGKTRALLAIGSLAYKPFFASGASTVSPIFHIQDAFQGTLILDEADFRFSDQTAELTKVFNNGTTSGLPVLRTMTNKNRELNPTAFRVFGPKIVAMRESFADPALESRFITEHTGGRTLRDDIPVHLPEAFKAESLALRNRLLAWRFASRRSVGPNLDQLPSEMSARAKQMSLALLSLIPDGSVRERICAALGAEEMRAHEARVPFAENLMARVVQEAFAAATTPGVSVAEVARRFNDRAAESLGQSMSNKWVGSFLRRRLGLATTKTGGVYVIPATERPQAEALSARHGAPQRSSPDTTPERTGPQMTFRAAI